MRPRGEEGSAIVEFCWLAIVLMVPLAYVVLAVFRVQAAAYGVAAASRDAGRAFVTAATGGEAEARALTAAAIVLRDQGIVLDPTDVSIACSATPCLSPGASVTVRIGMSVRLPLVPRFLGAADPDIDVSATHLEVVDPFSLVRP